jgi:phage terminase Nu1 subunit (DNA packaging protein)
VVTQAEIADALGISGATVSRFKRKGMPVSSIEAARAWRDENVRPRYEKPTGSIVDETARLKSAQADMAEMEAAEKRGELAPVSDMEMAASEAMVIVRTQLEAIAGRTAKQLAAMTDAAEIRQFTLNEIRRSLAAAADRLESWAALVAGRAVTSPAAESDAGSVG